MPRRRLRAPLPDPATPAPQRLLNIMAVGDGILFLPFLNTRDARHLRGVCRELRALVTNFAWDDRDPESRVVDRAGTVALWRTSFPRAVACTLWQGTSIENPSVTNDDLALLRGVRYLNMARCVNVTDVGIANVAAGKV